MPLTPKQREIINDKLDKLDLKYHSGCYASLREDGTLHLDSYFSKEYILDVLKIVEWID